MVPQIVLKMKEGKVCGPSGIVIEMVKAGGDAMTTWDDWDHSAIINCFKWKGDATRCGN